MEKTHAGTSSREDLHVSESGLLVLVALKFSKQRCLLPPEATYLISNQIGKKSPENIVQVIERKQENMWRRPEREDETAGKALSMSDRRTAPPPLTLYYLTFDL